MTTLFDPTQRTRIGPARRTEPHFDYWNESARPDIEPIRTRLEEWFSLYPRVHSPALRHRFRSRDNLVHLSALFELYVHEQLRGGPRSKSHATRSWPEPRGHLISWPVAAGGHPFLWSASWPLPIGIRPGVSGFYIRP